MPDPVAVNLTGAQAKGRLENCPDNVNTELATVTAAASSAQSTASTAVTNAAAASAGAAQAETNAQSALSQIVALATVASSGSATDLLNILSAIDTATGSVAWRAAVQHNVSGGRAPLASDNAAAGYSFLSRWVDDSVDPSEVYLYVSEAGGNAVWELTTLSVADLANVALSGSAGDLAGLVAAIDSDLGGSDWRTGGGSSSADTMPQIVAPVDGILDEATYAGKEIVCDTSSGDKVLVFESWGIGKFAIITKGTIDANRVRWSSAGSFTGAVTLSLYNDSATVRSISAAGNFRVSGGSEIPLKTPGVVISVADTAIPAVLGNFYDFDADGKILLPDLLNPEDEEWTCIVQAGVGVTVVFRNSDDSADVTIKGNPTPTLSDGMVMLWFKNGAWRQGGKFN